MHRVNSLNNNYASKLKLKHCVSQYVYIFTQFLRLIFITSFHFFFCHFFLLTRHLGRRRWHRWSRCCCLIDKSSAGSRPSFFSLSFPLQSFLLSPHPHALLLLLGHGLILIQQCKVLPVVGVPQIHTDVTGYGTFCLPVSAGRTQRSYAGLPSGGGARLCRDPSLNVFSILLPLPCS